MPYTNQIIFGAHHRPEHECIVGINWGTFTMFKGGADPQAVKKP